MTPLPISLIEHVASHLPLSSLVQFGFMSNYIHDVATKLCNLRAESAYKGVHPSCMCSQKPHWIRLKIATLPRLLISGCSNDWPELTRALPFTLDTKGPVFLEFRMVIANALNGSPRIGILDAESWRKAVPESERDWSCGRGDEAFAISMSPSGCEMLSTIVEGGSQRLEGLPSNPRPSGRSPRHEVYKARLNWPTETREHSKLNHPIRAGLFIKDGELSFWRIFRDGKWHSSGVICKDLPQSVLPCMFMFDFLGEAKITFERIRDAAPTSCCARNCRYQGTVDGWRKFP